MGAAFTIALLGGIESLLSGVVSDGMIGGRPRSNMELVAQGTANLVTPVLGGMPATGAIARTATNVKNGGRTPVAGMVHALTLLLITFLLTVVVDLTVAIEAGMVMAAFLFMKRMADVTNVNVVTREFEDDEDRPVPSDRPRTLPRGVIVYEINGPFFFGAAEQFRETLSSIGGRPRVLILRMRNVPAIDATGMHALAHLVRRTRHDGTAVILSEIQAQPAVALGRSGLLDQIGAEKVHATFDGALDYAAAISSSSSV
jgi:SulP family sulfate permease